MLAVQLGQGRRCILADEQLFSDLNFAKDTEVEIRIDLGTGHEQLSVRDAGVVESRAVPYYITAEVIRFEDAKDFEL